MHFDTYIESLRQWADKGPLKVSRQVPKANKQRLRCVKVKVQKCTVLCYVAHISFLNSIIDSPLCKALCLSLFENHYAGPREPLAIFTFIVKTFRVSVMDDADDISPVKRGEYLFRISRSLQLLKGCHVILAMIFVCICRCYGIIARIVHRYPAMETISGMEWNSKVIAWSEVFVPKDSIWKRVEFLTPRFQDDTFKFEGSVVKFPEHTRENEHTEKDEVYRYKGFIFVEKGNKIFVYTENVKVVLIIIFPSTKYKSGINELLYIREYPFEAERERRLIVRDFSSPSGQDMCIASKAPGGLYILSSNVLGIIADITPKYCKRWYETLVKREYKINEWFKKRVKMHNDGRKLRRDYIPRMSILNASIVEKADEVFIRGLIKQLPLPNSKMQFIKNPIYILKSQIPKRKILKADATPVGEFKGQAVYLRDDLEVIKTPFGWHKYNRRVIQGSKPVMIQRNKFSEKGESLYFAESQTVLDVAEDGLCDYKQVDLTGQRFVYKNHVYIKGKNLKHLEHVAKRMNIPYQRAFSSYKRMMPNTDGIVIAQEKLDSFLTSYNDYIENIISRDVEAERKTYRGFWRNFFLTLLNKPPSHAHYREIKEELKLTVEAFMGNLKE